jgi:hypothetical protein
MQMAEANRFLCLVHRRPCCTAKQPMESSSSALGAWLAAPKKGAGSPQNGEIRRMLRSEQQEPSPALTGSPSGPSYPVARGDNREDAMRTKFALTVVAGLLAGTAMAAAQSSGAPANEKDRTGQPTDSSTNSADPVRPGATQGTGTTGSGAVRAPQGGSSVTDPLPGEPTRGAAPRQGEGSGDDAIPRRK